MALSSDKQLLLCHQLFPHLEGRRVDVMLSSALASVRRSMEAAGFLVSDDEMYLASMGAGSGCEAVRSAGLEAREGLAGEGPALFIAARLAADVGAGMSLTFELTASRMTGGVFMRSGKAHATLSPMSVDALDARMTLTGALNRMFGGEQFEAAHVADQARDFCASLNEELVP